jgi:hypothetical protein
MTRIAPLAAALAALVACSGSDPAPKDTGPDCDQLEWYRDLDGDGYGDPELPELGCEQPEGYLPEAGDCDDNVADIHPGALETCDGRDEDCNDLIDDNAEGSLLFFADADADGYGDATLSQYACAQSPGWVPGNTDCDDADPDVFPGAEEVCNGVDDDCDGTPDDGLETRTFWADADADGYGDVAAPVDACAQPSGYVNNASDCDDADSAVNPLATELCNGADEDCDGEIDEPEDVAYLPYYTDVDGDGYGDPATELLACEPPKGLVDNGLDCDDADPAIQPGATEICNGIDDDCDAMVDDADPDVDASTAPFWYTDSDRDGHGAPATAVQLCSDPGDGWELLGDDCDDGNPDINPDADELCNSRDDDCDGVVDGASALDAIDTWRDFDEDGFGDDALPLRYCDVLEGYVTDAGDCDDMDPTIYPAAPETCDDPVDRNCDGAVGYVDADADGWWACEECDDSEPATNPDAPELCDGVDNDCNGEIDDDGMGGSPWAFYLDEDLDGFGAPGSFLIDCGGFVDGYADNDDDCDDTDPARSPLATEICNRVDDDCDGVVPPDEVDDDGDGVTECEGDPDDSDPTVSLPPCVMIDDFESGTWPAPGWIVQAAGGSVGASYAHDGSYGLFDPDWHYNLDTTVGNPGDILSAWIRPDASGRLYFGFGASASGAKSVIIAPNTTELLVQDNNGWGYSDVASTSTGWTYGDWYWLTVEFLGGNEIRGTAYLDDQVTVYATVTHTFSSSVVGGVAIRGFGSMATDTIEVCAAP